MKTGLFFLLNEELPVLKDFRQSKEAAVDKNWQGKFFK